MTALKRADCCDGSLPWRIRYAPFQLCALCSLRIAVVSYTALQSSSSSTFPVRLCGSLVWKLWVRKFTPSWNCSARSRACTADGNHAMRQISCDGSRALMWVAAAATSNTPAQDSTGCRCGTAAVHSCAHAGAKFGQSPHLLCMVVASSRSRIQVYSCMHGELRHASFRLTCVLLQSRATAAAL
jgi:hypothetical protein